MRRCLQRVSVQFWDCLLGTAILAGIWGFWGLFFWRLGSWRAEQGIILVIAATMSHVIGFLAGGRR